MKNNRFIEKTPFSLDLNVLKYGKNGIKLLKLSAENIILKYKFLNFKLFKHETNLTLSKIFNIFTLCEIT